MSYEYRAPSLHLIDTATLIKQGAEARVYALDALLPSPSVYWPSSSSASSSSPAPTPAILKHRFPKTYRHPALDASLNKTRLQFEARALFRCARAGVTVPRVLWVDEPGGTLALERIEGWSVREVLGGGAEGEVEVGANDERERDGTETPREDEEVVVGESEGMAALAPHGGVPALMTAVGEALARLHHTGVVHGDLTTSNMMVRMTPDGASPYEIVLIDFGLASQATLPENYAVDLYVLERAFASTHPASEGMYAGVLEAYAAGLGEKKWKPIEAKLKEVRLRGRKRDMTG
ncbi:kinase-like protein [Cutaneotrichosporon oleaginosum]|uniref:EKC/KEOPS complex subunit BUD32 n=1 Tax=Cutaneotrichosporon oleaginosum TaxID=879819 RepID=A0A0J0XZ83_9TREE|nr:kinase-like protein [Cutaneotrichosporon oleaginosum]KLT46372.1 kinase-like protein [Cutaneotrichosporon oleaginosum]TXT15258.1 hypothetical protein COLE_01451 [Cutaneotrichosporon oleaginosum]